MEIKSITKSDFSAYHLSLLHEIPEPPKELWYSGLLPPPSLHLIAVVGSRAYTTYGKQVVEKLISELAPYPIGIVSGLALGIDGLAHEAALKHNLYTLAVPGSGLEESVLYPASHRNLARNILAAGGGLLSELAPTTPAAKWTFPRRNRIMVGLCKAVLLIEAAEKSGTLITARLAADYNRELLAVPGSIFSKNSYGTHQFLKLGATLVTTGADILDVLNLPQVQSEVPSTPNSTLSPLEQKVLAILHEPQEKDTLVRELALPVSEVNILLMNMEMLGYIHYESPYYESRI